MPTTREYPIVYDDSIWTYLDYLELPNDGKRYQVIHGVLYMTPSPTSYHQKISRNLEFLLWHYVKEHELGEVFYAPIDVILSNADVVLPDIVFVRKERAGIIREKGIFGAPDLIVEIISPSTHKMDEKLKKDLYEKEGVREYLMVYPEQQRIVHYLIESGSYRAGVTYPMGDTFTLKTIPLSLDTKAIF
jgi:Uma2 family endonuclease